MDSVTLKRTKEKTYTAVVVAFVLLNGYFSFFTVFPSLSFFLSSFLSSFLKIFSACVIGTEEAVGLNRAGVRVLLALKILFVTFYNKATSYNK